MPILIVRLWGCSPVQAEGYIFRHPFYFRARGDSWQFAVATSKKPGRYAAMDVASGQASGFLLTRRYGQVGGLDASAMSYAAARQIIDECADAYARMKQGGI